MAVASKLEDRLQLLNEATAAADPDLLAEYNGKLLMSWIYHDHGLEGGVYTFHELRAAIDDQVVSDTSLIPVFDEIRNYRDTIKLLIEVAERPKVSWNLELLKSIYVSMDPEEGEGKGAPRFRKDMPLHRLYFHELAQPEKIPGRLKELFDWIQSSGTKKSVHLIRQAARVHHDLIHIYPFQKNSGKVARLFMNAMLMKNGYPPAIIHATERQMYYEALRTSVDATAEMIFDSLDAAIESTIKFLGQPADSGTQSA